MEVLRYEIDKRYLDVYTSEYKRIGEPSVSTFKHMVSDAVDDTSDYVAAHAQAIATATGESLSATHNAVIAELKKSLHASRPGIADGRTALWRVRVQLMPNLEGSAVEADTNPELSDIDAPGTTLLRGLSSVADFVAEVATSYHAGREVQGLGDETLRQSLKSLRVTLSRLNGQAVWRPHYILAAVDTGDVVQPVAGSLRGLTGGKRPAVEWVARVRVERVPDNVT